MPDEDLPIYPLRQGDTLSGDWVEWRTRAMCNSEWMVEMSAKPEVGFFSLRLIAEAYQQDPCGTLPDSDAALAQLAGLGLAVARWQRLRAAGALRGWGPCMVLAAGDGAERRRLAHPVVTDVAMRSWTLQRASREGATEGARRKQMSRVRAHLRETGLRSELVRSDRYVGALLDRLRAANRRITREAVEAELVAMSQDNVANFHDFTSG